MQAAASGGTLRSMRYSFTFEKLVGWAKTVKGTASNAAAQITVLPENQAFFMVRPPLDFVVKWNLLSLYTQLLHPKALCLVKGLAVLAVHDRGLVVVNQIIMTVHALLFIARPGVQHGAMGHQHAAPAVGHIEQIPVAFQALAVVEGGIGQFPRLSTVIGSPVHKVDGHILDAMDRLGKKEIEHILGREIILIPDEI
jgi:hypothetical protein